ncbi:ABC transporter permease [Paenibacillus sp. MAH-36]|uniref:ABC transporter permease n=1 Tax=Paenibacillus violae TaxID=3077234 RepID=A0ABU3RKQ7_9BACL|nr:ABC transporter permease [Paenibacillus sp. PFR10]MDU0204787.1 ABC transporter permease [Paenibacillus sp. PFR10]
MMKRLLTSREFGVALLLILVTLIMTMITPNFLTSSNVMNILITNSVLGIMSVGMTIVILTGGIDVSVAAILAVSSVLVAKYVISTGANLYMAFLVGAGCGLVLGLLNSLFIVYGKIPAIIVTLGTMGIFRGTILQVTNGEWIVGFPAWYSNLNAQKVVGLPLSFLIFLGIALISGLLLRYTRIGRQIYAFGGNEESAVRIGIRVKRLQIFVYMYMGLICGVASVVYGAIQGSVQPNAAVGFELSIVAAVVVGGVNIMGGSGSVLGTVLGVMFLGLVNNALVLAHVETYWQNVVVGMVILLAITVDVLNRKVKLTRRARA